MQGHKYRLMEPEVISQRCWLVMEACYSKTWKAYHMQPHCHQRAEIMYVLKGWCIVHLYRHRTQQETGQMLLEEEQSIKLSSGQMIWVDAGYFHALEVPESSYMLNVEFSIQRDDQSMLSLSGLSGSSAMFRAWLEQRKPYVRVTDYDGELHGALYAVVDDFAKMKNSESVVRELHLGQLLLHVAQAVHDEGENELCYVRKAVQLLNESIEEDVRVQTVARQLGLSASYLQRIFKRVKGMTMIAYLNQIRIERSKLLLTCTDDPIVDIAIASGYHSRQHFSRVFSALVGQSPQQYRQAAKDEERRQLFLFDE